MLNELNLQNLVISVITVTYNSGGTIADTLKSIDGQSRADFEHWVIDGASDDSTLSIVNEFPLDSRHVISEKDSGVYNAMNRGIEASSGDVIGFLNADDFYETPGVLAAVADAFDQPDIDIVFGNLRYVSADDTGHVIRDWVSEPYRPGMFRSGWVPPHPTVYARRRVFEEIGGFDESFPICADWEWLYRAFEVKGLKTKFIDKYMVRMRVGGVSNRSLANILGSNRQEVAAFKKHGENLPLGFFPGKLLHRGKQFLARGTRC